MKRKGKVTTVLLLLMFFAGLSLLLYPVVSEYWNSRYQSQVIVDYAEQVDQLELENQVRLRQAAQEFNAALRQRDNPFALTEEQMARYEAVLNPTGSGVMGYLEIPSIGCSLPIEHGTDDSVLDQAVGHLEWSYLPVGGESTHCVLSGHRGLPSAELLTNIDRLEIGDVFYIHVLGEQLEYQVDQISVTEPADLSLLTVEEGMDHVTLVTCTPYGINSHRLLVRGVRVDREDEEQSSLALAVSGDGTLVNAGYPTFLAMLVILTGLFFILLLSKKITTLRGGTRLRSAKEVPHENHGGKN